MFKYLAFVLLALSACLATSNVYAQATLGQPIPYQLLGGHIVVEARYNGQGPFLAQIDDGCQDMLLNAHEADQIGLHPTGVKRISSFGPNDITMFTSTPAAVSFGGSLITGQVMQVCDFKQTLMDAGHGIQSIIGQALFNQYVVKIDSSGSTVTLYDPQSYSPPTKCVTIPITIGERGIPLAAATVNGASGMFQLDLGSTGGVTLYPGFVAKNSEHFSMDGATKLTVPEIGGSSALTVLPRAGDLDLGPLKAKTSGIVVLATDPPHFGVVDVAGNLGASLWQHLTVVFDLPHQRIIVSEP